ncbi:uncharacterized protein KY384_002158 [Bacidia gigantensis]|uniref:uncharacterized protein n=1 Tax=Bacidia gigantensis TaxID=2732470 RepID=UPI001D047AD3|nr:uncharacterized protein KY384_002158 [Bacidia gigantensis]KAG8533375.1 hypothetical protein KY384_002158 [Bacidia gigantensis]
MDAALLDATNQQMAIQAKCNTQQTLAKKQFDNDDEVGLTPNPGFYQYVMTGQAPCFSAAKQHLDSIGLGYEVTGGSSTANNIDTKLKETTSGGGSISVFGILVNVGASGSKSTENNNHNATWDNSSRIFKVVPAQDVGFANIVGLVSEKFTLP